MALKDILNVKEYTVFRGVDLSSPPAAITDDHASDMLNMYIGEDGIIQKRPGWHILKTFANITRFISTASYEPGEFVKKHVGNVDTLFICVVAHSGAWDDNHFSKAFSSSTIYAIGDYANKGGAVYRFTAAHHGEWNDADAVVEEPPRLPVNGIFTLNAGSGNDILFVHAGQYLFYHKIEKPLRNFWDVSAGDVPWEDVGRPTQYAVGVMQNFIKGRIEVQPWQVRNMDLDGDGVVTSADVDKVRLIANNLSNPACAEIQPNEGWNVPVKGMQLNNARSVSFEHDGNLYILDGANYLKCTPTFDTVTVDGESIKRFVGVTISAVTGYIPTTGVNGHYEYDELNEEGTNTPGSAENPGTWHRPKADEKRNLIQTKQINTFTADGIHKAFYLLENNCIVNKVELLIKTRCHAEDGRDVPDPDGHESGVYYYWKYIWTEVQSNDPNYGWTATDASETTPVQNDISYSTKIQFMNVSAAIDEGAVNIRVTYSPRKHSSVWAINKDTGYIYKCTIATKYGYFNDNRIILSGNPEHRNWDFMSAVDDPTYFPNDCWTAIGSPQTAIMGYLHYGSELAIVKEDNEQDATIYMRSANLAEEGYIYFPVQQGAESVGAISKGCFATLRDDPLFLAREGLFAIEGTDASQERNVPNRSYFVDTKLTKDATQESIMTAWGNYLIVCSPSTGRCYVADARYQNLPPGTNNRHRIYEWYLWDNIPAISFCVWGNLLFFGTLDGRLCQFHPDWIEKKYQDGAQYVDGATKLWKWNPYDGGYPIHAYYVTKRDHLGSMDFKKTMLNDGGCIMLYPQNQSSAAISVKTDRGEWFVDGIQTDSDEPSIVVPIRKRVKNFDSIETRIENNEINEGLAILGVQYRYAITTNRR